jgi:hypothetical protein
MPDAISRLLHAGRLIGAIVLVTVVTLLIDRRLRR